MLTPQFTLALATKLVVDLFAGAGGASTGMEQALGRHVDIAINHNPKAVAQHRANHPQTLHLQSSVWDVNPLDATGGRAVGLLWASPDCRHFSPAKGAAPVSDRVRSLAWVVIRWAHHCQPDLICMENIPEFRNWGPVVAGRPCPDRKGKTFKRFVRQLERTGPGYDVEVRNLVACEYGVPTTRKRLFLIAKKRGTGPIVWPAPTHGPGLKPYRTAADCIDWSIPCVSIFASPEEAKAAGVKRPLAPATLRRIAHGVRRYVLEAAKPFIVPVTHQGGPARVHSVDEPVRTVTGANRGELALAVPHLVQITHGDGKPGAPARWGSGALPIDEPLRTVTTAKRGEFALVTAFLAKHFGGEPAVGKTAASLEAPAPTVTARDHTSLVTSNLVKLRGTGRSQATDQPLHTISAGGQHHAEVRVFLTAYYGTDQAPELGAPLPTVTTKHRFGLVTVHGVDYQMDDIGMRMLQPRELARAQGFDDSYIIEWGLDEHGRRVKLTKEDQVHGIGNSVCPALARAIVGANYSDVALRAAA
jgi:DNA (cytosine-5)-methyltransferase 1